MTRVSVRKDHLDQFMAKNTYVVMLCMISCYGVPAYLYTAIVCDNM